MSIETPARPADGERAATPQRSFIGRQRETTMLRDGLRSASTGRGRLYLLAGEPGIGKTRLATELAADASRSGALALWGRCWEGGGAPAYWPWVQILRAHARSERDNATGSSTAAAAAELAARLTQGSAGDGGGAALAAAAEIEQARFHLFDSVTLFLQRLAAVQPLLLVLDDLHAADQPSLLLLQFIARALPQLPILALGTYRSVEVRRCPALAGLFADLTRDGHLLHVGGLSVTEVSELITQTGAPACPDAVMSAVHQVTGGNPFFVDEIARLLTTEQRWQGVLEGTGTTFKIPDGVRDAIRRRLDPLAEETRSVLTLASVIGREFDLGVLERVAALSLATLLERLGEAVGLDVIDTVPGTIGRYSFAHALIRETLRHDLPPAQRMELHHAVGKALQETQGQSETNLAELAHHFFQAAAAGAAAEATDYAARAGDHALRLLAYEEAANHYSRALEALKFQPPDEPRRCELLLALGDAQRRAALSPAANDSFRRAANVARKIGAAAQFADAALGCGRAGESGSVDPTLVAMLEEALERLGPDDSARRARVLGRLAMALYFGPQHERRAALSTQAVDMARRLGDRSALVAALIARHFAVWAPDTTAARLAVASEIVHTAEAIGEPDLALEGRLWRMVDLLESGDAAAFHLEWERFEHTTAALRLPAYQWHSALVQAMLALADGQIAAAEQASRAALAIGERTHIGRAPQLFGVQLFYVRRQQGRLGELEDAVRTFAEQLPTLPIWRCGLAVLYAATAQTDAAQREFERLAGRDFRDLPHDGNWLPAMALLAEVCACLGDRERAALLYELLLPFADRNVVIADGVVCAGPVAHALGLLAATRQQWGTATTHFEAAIALSHRFFSSQLVTDSRAALARVQAAQAMPSDQKPVQGHGEGTQTLQAAGAPPRRQPASTQPEMAPLVGDADACVFRKDGAFWTVAYSGTVLRLKDSRGLSYLRMLLRHPGRSYRAAELVAAAQGDAPLPAESGAPDGPPDTESARIAVTKAIALVLKAIAERNPALRLHLGNTIKTGRVCSYQASDGSPVAWNLGD